MDARVVPAEPAAYCSVPDGEVRMTLEQLNACSKKDLADKAKSLGIAGFASMKKEDLVKAILRISKKKEAERLKAKEAKPAPAPKKPVAVPQAAPKAVPTPKIAPKA